MGTKVGELFVSIGIDAATGNLAVHSLTSAFGSLVDAGDNVVKQTDKIGNALWGMTTAAVETAVSLMKLHDFAGVDPHVTDQWEKASVGIVHSAGTITGAIASIQEMNEKIGSGLQSPKFTLLTNWLHMTAGKTFDAKGHVTSYKNGMDYLTEMADPRSMYHRMSPQQQQLATSGMFGQAGPGAFLLLKHWDQFRPENMPGMSNRTIAGLNTVDSDWQHVKQDVTGMFERLLTGGEMVDKILVGSEHLLEAVNRILDSPSMNKLMASEGDAIKDALTGKFGARDYLNVVMPGFGDAFGVGSAIDNYLRSLAPHGGKLETVQEKNVNFNMTVDGKKVPTDYSQQGLLRGDGWSASWTMGNSN